jgi:hypothetical protein
LGLRLESRGNTPRLYRNTLVFLAADKTRLQDLDEAARKYLAWVSTLTEQKDLNLYLPRLRDPSVLLHAIGDGMNLLTLQLYGDNEGRRGVRVGEDAPGIPGIPVAGGRLVLFIGALTASDECAHQPDNRSSANDRCCGFKAKDPKPDRGPKGCQRYQ